MASKQGEIKAAELDGTTELGSRAVIEHNNCNSFIVYIHEVAVLNLGLTSDDEVCQHYDAENERLIIEKV